MAAGKMVTIGIDQSYQRTGICVVMEGQKKALFSIDLSKFKTNSERRQALRQRLEQTLQFVLSKTEKVVCIVERVRLFSGHEKSFLNINYIKSIGALNACIVDVCHTFGIKVWSVDTRCWKASVVGTSKPMSNDYGVPPEKWPTIMWCIHNGWTDDITIELPPNTKRRKHTFERDKDRKLCIFDTDAADAAGIAMFPFVGDRKKLIPEN